MFKLSPHHRGAKIIATLGPSTWTPEGMSRLLAADVDVVRFNVKHQTPAENQLLLDMWRAVAEQDWQAQQERLGLRGLVNAEASPVGIMVGGVNLCLISCGIRITGAAGAGEWGGRPCRHHAASAFCLCLSLFLCEQSRAQQSRSVCCCCCC
jgi:hypothetical protein